jgi:hypothetical protein
MSNICLLIAEAKTSPRGLIAKRLFVDSKPIFGLTKTADFFLIKPVLLSGKPLSDVFDYILQPTKVFIP